MTELNKCLILKTSPVAKAGCIIDCGKYRVTVLTSRLVRVERGNFTDEATQIVINRDFPTIEFSQEKKGSVLTVTTSRCVFRFSSGGKLVGLKLDGKAMPLRDSGNLGGTCRTLDMRIGRVGLGKGIISRSGVTFLCDDALILKPDGTVAARDESDDTYIFCYGDDYRAALKDYFELTGYPPMLPRYAFGNWWSRYRAYTQKEYLDLMDRFAAANIPLTVATVDMDWHWVDVNRRFNKKFPPAGFMQCPGWTGYSWNTELFPDYREFLTELKKRNLRVTLNLHPSDGVRCFEDMYKEMAAAMGVDPTTEHTIPFDLGNSKFLNNYFDVLHHPYENEGVDFWWIDWQQGKKSTVKDLDPLWALNHYHYLDNARKDRGIILSRYAGAGSHRYPLGFSGDCVTVWKSLNFQPELTATAANIGYGYWSHDIGGHTFGVCDDELYLRWCQLGVFSPVNRLHSTSHDLQGKEPWKRSETVNRIVSDYLRFRHRLIPYVYSATRAANTDGRPLCEPMYYEYPSENNAYRVPNQYFFGSELIVCPITSPLLKNIQMAKTKLWVPEGRFTDIYTGKIYRGNKIITVYRDREYIPVLAKEGAIVPLSADAGNDCTCPVNMEILVYRGNNEYTLYEDDGLTEEYRDGEYAETVFKITETDGKITFSVSPTCRGNKFRLPEGRNYKLVFKDIFGGVATVDGQERPFDGTITVTGAAKIEITGYTVATNGTEEERNEKARRILSRYQASIINKTLRYLGMKKITSSAELIKTIKRRFPRDVYLAAKEEIEE